MSSEPLLVSFIDNSTGHNDIHVCIAGYSRIADSYYFALDRGILCEDESATKVRKVLIRLMQHWIDALTLATPARPVYLPFDFSDEYTGCFRCRPSECDIEVLPGFSRREGWSFFPSDPGDYFFGVSDFQKDTATPVLMTRAEFVGRIQRSIESVESQLPKAGGQLNL